MGAIGFSALSERMDVSLREFAVGAVAEAYRRHAPGELTAFDGANITGRQR